jgi:hypothetical protein
MIARGDGVLPRRAPPRGRSAIGQLVHERLRDVLDRREPAGQVPVQRRVPRAISLLFPWPAPAIRTCSTCAISRLPRMRAWRFSSATSRFRSRRRCGQRATVRLEGLVDARRRPARSRAGGRRPSRRSRSPATSTATAWPPSHRPRAERVGGERRDEAPNRSRRTARAPPRGTRSSGRSRRRPEHQRPVDLLRLPRPRRAGIRGRTAFRAGDGHPAGTRSGVAASRSTTSRSSRTSPRATRASPSGATTMEPPSNTSSSWPPTRFTYTIHAPVSGPDRARTSQPLGRFPAGTATR